MDNARPITITIRSATPSDYELCAELDHAVSTEVVWQMVVDDSDNGQNVTFRAARLPRSMPVRYPRQGEKLGESWNLHAAFLVAEWEENVIGYVNIREERSQETT